MLACAFAIQLGTVPRTAIALAMPIAVLALTIGNITNALFPVFVIWQTSSPSRETSKASTPFIGESESGAASSTSCCAAALFGSDAIQGLFVHPALHIDGCGVAANILPAMGFAMLGRLVLTKQLVPFYFLGFLLCSYANVPVLGVALIAIIIGIDKFDLLGLGGAQPQLSAEGDEDDDF